MLWQPFALADAGFVQGRNVSIEFRWADYDYQRLPALAGDLVARKVATVFAIGAVNATMAAKSATTTIPIVFVLGSDPVELGVVSSLNRPVGNVTGMMMQGTEIIPKRLEILRELLPGATSFGQLSNPKNRNTEPSVAELQAIAQAGGVALHVVPVTSEAELEGAFATLSRLQVSGFLNTTDAIFTARQQVLVDLAARYRIPSVYGNREYTDVGGLMNYGANFADVIRKAAVYVGRILRGEKPSNLPVQQPTKYEMVINQKTANELGLTIPPTLLLRADEVIE